MNPDQGIETPDFFEHLLDVTLREEHESRSGD
jgi:hypothetical protein